MRCLNINMYTERTHIFAWNKIGNVEDVRGLLFSLSSEWFYFIVLGSWRDGRMTFEIKVLIDA